MTLIDALDTLVIMGNYSEFRSAVDLVNRTLPDFSYDVNVSVFETTIRVLGGLISAHLFAGDISHIIHSFCLLTYRCIPCGSGSAIRNLRT